MLVYTVEIRIPEQLDPKKDPTDQKARQRLYKLLGEEYDYRILDCWED